MKNRKELKEFLKSKIKTLTEEEKLYLKEEIKSISSSEDWNKVIELYNQKKKLETNPKNILSLYLLGIAPYPKKFEHLWEISDMCDIDLDYPPSKRDKVKEYLYSKYGRENCIPIGTYGTLGLKGSIQEISRVFNIPPSEYIQISKLVTDEDKNLSVSELREKYPKIDKFFDKYPEISEISTKLVGMKKSIGSHAGGFIVSSDSVYKNIPIVKSSKTYVSGWQESGAVKELESLGFIKIDILGLDMLDQVKTCVTLIKENHPNNNLPEDIFSLPIDDEKVYDFINTLDTDNIFQMESKVFKDAIKQIKPKTLEDLSNISTLIRPGSAEVKDYVRMKNVKRKEPKCLHEVYNPTRGLMIYQEQLMQVLTNLGNFTIFEADKVRRLVRKIGKSKTSDENRSLMLEEAERYKNKFIKASVKKIVEEDKWTKEEAKKYVENQWSQLMAQAKYSFNKSHSMAYSLMGYVQAWLKYYFPLEFWVSSLNTIDRGLEKHGQNSLQKYINLINKTKYKVVKPDIRYSKNLFSIAKNKIYFGLSYIKDVSNSANNLDSLRGSKDFFDFINKATSLKINKRVIKALIFSGAVDFNDLIEDRADKWLYYLKTKKGKKAKEELDEYIKNKPKYSKLLKLEYDYCKYLFTKIDDKLFSLKNGYKLISNRDEKKTLWSLVGYIEKLQKKKSKKTGNQYLLVTLTDFRDSISVFAFGSYLKEIPEIIEEGDLVTATIKNDKGWLKFPWESEIYGNFPIKKLD